jgi:glycosyltransferase involved in cell wall biosynthesis
MSYSIIIPVYNEIFTLPRLVKNLRKLNNDIQIILVDDGSDDGSDEILKKHAKRIDIIRNETNLGKGSSIVSGLEFVKNQNIILIDGDLEIEIDCIPKLIVEYEKNNYSTLIGYRWDDKDGINFELNRLGNYIINSLFNVLYFSSIKDVLCCVRIIRSDLIKSLNLKSKRFSIEVETLAKLVLFKKKIIQSRVGYNRRTMEQGKKLKMSDGWRIITVMLYYKFLYKI